MTKVVVEHQDVSFIPLTQKWVSLVWPLIEPDAKEMPKSWPTNKAELEAWALGTRKKQTIADRSIILVQDEETGEFLPVGLITGDLVNGSTSSNFPGAKFGDVNIAYFVFSKYRGKGFAQKALNQVRRAWIEDNKHPVLRIAKDNLASQAVAAGAGFSFDSNETVSGRSLMLFRSES